MARVLTHILRLKGYCSDILHPRFVPWTKPLTSSLLLGTLADLSRSKSQLIAENALLRQQLIILNRQVKRPAYRKMDRMLLVLLARSVRTWQHALFIVQPETLLRWHRELFRLVWKRRSKVASHQPKIAAETVALIREMAVKNRLWGAERICGELLKLGLHVCKRTIQKYIRRVRTPQPRGQRWATFLRNHAADIWACDFLQVSDLFFRPLFAFFITHIPQFRERKNRIVNTQDQGDKEPADEALAAPEPAFASVTQCECARDQYPQNIGKSSASWGGWSVC